MGYHNETCGCAECGNYGQPYNPHAIHNQSCGCAECGNYGQSYNAGAIHNQSCGCAECNNYPSTVHGTAEAICEPLKMALIHEKEDMAPPISASCPLGSESAECPTPERTSPKTQKRSKTARRKVTKRPAEGA